MTSLSPNGLKRDQSSISSIEGNKKVEINVWRDFEVKSLFLRSLSQNIAVLTPRGDVINSNWV